MKKIVCLVMALAMLLGLCACGGQSEKEKLIVGFDPEFPPYGYVAADGSYDGFDLALAKEVCDRLGWDFEAKPIDWTAKDSELKSGTISCLWNGFTYEGREEDYTWSDRYVDNKIVVVVKKDSGITKLADLAGKKVMAQAASSGLEALEGNEALASSLQEIVQLGDYNLGFMELKQGTVAAVVADEGVANKQVKDNGDDYVILDEYVSREQYGIGFLKGNTELRDKVNEQLLAMAKDGTMKKIAEKYVDEGLVLDSLVLCQ